mgnify:CR=1 FL=1
MEWVIAVLSIGCLYFIFQIAFGYLRHKSIVTGRLEQLEESRNQIEEQIKEAKDELRKSRADLGPAKEAVVALESEYQSLQDQIEFERENTRKDSRGIQGRNFDEKKP